MPKELEITGKTIDFSHVPQVDPEGQRAQVRYETRVGGGMGQLNDGSLGSIPGQIIYETSVAEMSAGARTACAACRNWSQKDFREWVGKMTGPLSKPSQHESIKSLKNRLALAYGIEHVETAMMSLGVCRVLSEIIKGWVGETEPHWPMYSMNDANCPPDVRAGLGPLGIPNRVDIVTDAAPLGLFKPVDNEAIAIGDQRRDGILYGAAGKVR